MSFKYIFILFTVLPVLLSACKKDYTPKPLGFNRIDVPKYNYTEYTNSILSFVYSDLAQVKTIPNKDSLYWFNIVYPELGATIYCSYIGITHQTFNKALEDSYHLAYSHSVKAEGIDQNVYEGANNRHIGGILYELEGDVATPIQFFVTDSTSNFLRGSFYYDSKVNLDSIEPITQMIKKDILELFNSIEFGKKRTKILNRNK